MIMSGYPRQDEKQIFSYVDGIPVKISEKYKPPRKVTLPVGYQHRLLRDPVNYGEYDFKLEDAVLSKIQEWRNAQALSERLQRCRILEEDAVRATTSTASTNSTPTTTLPSTSVSNHYAILMPVPISRPASSTSTQDYSSPFNLSDFEADTSSPFDNVELKTINDMEELAHVLHPDPTPPTASNFSQSCQVVPTPPVVNSFSQPCPSVNHAVPSSSAQCQGSANGLPGYGYSANPQGSYAQLYGPESGTVCDPTDCQSACQPQSSLSKSVPDIVKALEQDLRERTTCTPPPRPSSFGYTGLEDWTPWPVLDSPERSTAGCRTTRTSTLPNPFRSLSSSEQKLARHISEMGFPLARVARACQTFGNNEKMVVEFLLQVHSLEERGHPGDRAENALVLNDYNLSQAEEHLSAMGQLLDLGFPESLVSRALLDCGNDRDRALDALIS
ncbi:ubiquitin-associated protein 1 [Bacillus rossius redtenbacheri]|uniref:ubiquitin-associated protein 1 n=1 Tax=Bacillus rossius redtenbacheri TaxID=93214 RepID=UPI002FDE4BC4